MKCIRLRVCVTVGVNVGALGLSVSVVVLLLLLLLLFVCFCVMLCESGGDSFMYVSFMCMSGVSGVNCGEGMLVCFWCTVGCDRVLLGCLGVVETRCCVLLGLVMVWAWVLVCTIALMWVLWSVMVLVLARVRTRAIESARI